MNIIGTEFSLTHRAYEIYLAGCKAPHCPGCHNPETWDFNAGFPADLCMEAIERTLSQADDMIQNIWILGGEPLDQDLEDLERLLIALRKHGKPLWLFTRRTYTAVPLCILRLVDYVKTGPYRADLPSKKVCYGIKLASENQGVTKVEH